jgi:AraC-like DNA-binding protein
VRSVQPALARLRALGLDVEAVLVAAGARPEEWSPGDGRVPHDLALAVWREAVRASGDDAFGLHAAEGLAPGAFDVLDYAIRSSATLAEGLARLERYHRILHDAARVRVDLVGDDVAVTHLPLAAAPALPRHVAEFIVGAWTVVARQATGVELAPREVTFRHDAPTDLAPHRRLFRAPIRFGAPANSIRLPSEHLRAPLLRSDPGLCALLERQVADALERLPRAGALAERVRAVVADQLSTGVPSGAAVARRLHMSPRTLQRHLRGDGTNLRALVEALRRDLATRYLADRRVAIAEVAFLLGFSEASAFHRAFKRWTGSTPHVYRKRSEGDAA